METESDEESDGYEYSPSDNDDDMSGNPNAAPMNYKGKPDGFIVHSTPMYENLRRKI